MADDLATTAGELLPLFPLEAVLFPDMFMPLHIFEPRYQLLIQRSLERAEPFGVVLIREGQEVGETAVPHRVGTQAEIVAHAALPDGRSLITVRGGRRFEIASVLSDAEPYPVGRVRYLDDAAEEDERPLANSVAEAYADYVVGVVAATGGVRQELPVVDEIRGGTPSDVSFRVAAGLAVEDDEQQTLLEATSARDRLAREREILARECSLLTEMLVRMRVRGEGPTLH